MPVFFIENEDITSDLAYIKNRSDLKHILNVLRKKIGDKIELITPNKEILYCEIVHLSKDNICSKIIKKEKSNKFLSININLIQSVLKSNAQDFVIQKATELGVNQITPVLTRYSVPSFKNTTDIKKKVDKWQVIANESCKQCERATIPVINNIEKLSEVLNNIDCKNTLACAERSTKITFKDALAHINKDKQINIIIGPEGGWSDTELELFKSYNIQLVSLGNLILRAETASIKSVSNIIYEYENN